MTIKVDSRKVEKELTKLEKFFGYVPNEVVNEVGNFSVFKIQERTGKSVDVNNKSTNVHRVEKYTIKVCRNEKE